LKASPGIENPRDRQGMPRALAIVPARLGSTRMPRKMLRRDTGRCLFEHTVRNAARAASIRRVVLATDAEEIVAAARAAGIEAVLTSAEHQSGTDRVHEAWQMLAARERLDCDVIVNVQGDEPELPPEDLDRAVAAFADAEVAIATLCAPLEARAEALSPSVVKVVRDARGDALYFSRSPLPAPRPGAPGLPPMLRHIGLYAFRPRALAEFCALPPGTLERAESLEQLRWLEAGRRMRVLVASRATVGIDTEEDYAAFVKRCGAQGRPGERVAEETGTR
jgi:3-deoxy-manno-octulosonate cytidylyltransferase (CMP-KDO synthetase)